MLTLSNTTVSQGIHPSFGHYSAEVVWTMCQKHTTQWQYFAPLSKNSILSKLQLTTHNDVLVVVAYRL